ncbi:hypothetical protein G7068_03305 [Leucobacter viscericola]|uniref:Major tail protein n=1 Tax=Leucobacter viscericola TaxID=2714935 RepID=A0A6G7XCW2_9MICO|nr:hypothetical protein [Leucobacter viscericola]QIK62342.1 hypothetical protein G7068_03305 [Leucobacter viscericola]
MAKNQDNMREWNAEESGVWIAPKGSTLPATDLTIPPEFMEVGWITDGGIEESVEVESKETKAWQGGAIVKLRNTSTKKSHKFAALEDDPEVTGLYYGHGKPTLVGTGTDKIARVDMPKSIPTIERTVIIKLVDNAGYTRLKCIETASVSERGSYVTNLEDDSVYEFGLTETGNSYWLSNEPAFLEAAA